MFLYLADAILLYQWKKGNARANSAFNRPVIETNNIPVGNVSHAGINNTFYNAGFVNNAGVEVNNAGAEVNHAGAERV